MSDTLEREDFEEEPTPNHTDRMHAICPYCDFEDWDSWSIDLDTDKECKNCGRTFWVEPEIVRQFTTYRMKGEQ
ncbi:MAG: hypothetical protein PHN44_04070 [Candidatus Marinimicrobia bacterium]|nr:hypothetical protein [Candidatus Neomarinimicrobiota bacterium]